MGVVYLARCQRQRTRPGQQVLQADPATFEDVVDLVIEGALAGLVHQADLQMIL